MELRRGFIYPNLEKSKEKKIGKKRKINYKSQLKSTEIGTV